MAKKFLIRCCGFIDSVQPVGYGTIPGCANTAKFVRPARRPIGFAVGWLILLLPMSSLDARRDDPGLPARQPVVYDAEVDALIHPVSAEYIIQTLDRRLMKSRPI